MMYARTMSWISRKVSPTFLFLTSTIRGVSYSKRKEDTLSMHFCPMAAPGLCCSLPALHCALGWAVPAAAQAVPLFAEEKKKKENKNAIGVALCTSGLSGFLLCEGMRLPLPISSGLGTAGALHGLGVGRGVGGWEGATPLPSPHATRTKPSAREPCSLARQGPSLGTERLQAGLGMSRDHEASPGATVEWKRL